MDLKLEYQDLGVVSYRRAWGVQEELRARRLRNEIPDTVLLLEHPPVFTLGKRDCPEDIVSSAEEIAAEGIEIVKTNRGGRVTYHGPGQLVGYFICSVDGLGIKHFVWLIEELLIKVLDDFGIKGSRDSEHPGIWVGEDKIAAIGLNVSRGITQHGFALNVNPNLDHYRHIIPCGIKGRGITSLAAHVSRTPSMEEVKSRVLTHLGPVFGK